MVGRAKVLSRFVRGGGGGEEELSEGVRGETENGGGLGDEEGRRLREQEGLSPGEVHEERGCVFAFI